MANAVSVAPSVNPIVAYVRDVMSSLQDARARNAVYRRTVNELSGLSNRDLADLGIARASIKGIAYEHAYGK